MKDFSALLAAIVVGASTFPTSSAAEEPAPFPGVESGEPEDDGPADNPSALPDAETPAAFVIVVGSGRSDRPGTAALRYADDDAARYVELFSLFAEQVEFLAVLDAETQARHPGLAARTRMPSRSELLGALERTQEAIAAAKEAGRRTAFYFVFAGHGDVGDNQEGYLVLQDGRFTRSDLYQHVVIPSKADVNHLILDSCRAYFMVARRGPGAAAAVRELLDAESLDRYPNVGVLLATTDAAEVHEWSRYAAGVFSHEVRSAVAGAADLDRDQRVTYLEAGAFIAAANVKVRDPRGKLSITALPPRMDREAALVDWRGAEAPAFVELSLPVSEPVYLEDDRGVRLADLHPEAGRLVSLALAPGRRVFVRGGNWETQIETRRGERVEVASLERTEPSFAVRGSVTEAFERGLFRIPFGDGFYQGYLQSNPLGMTAPIPTAFTPPKPSRRIAGWTGTGAAVGFTVSGLWYAQRAREDAARYRRAFGTAEEVAGYRKAAQRNQDLAMVLAGSAVATGVASSWLLWSDRRRAFSFQVGPGEAAVTFSFTLGDGEGRP